MSDSNEAVPYDILTTLFRALVWCGDQITQEQREAAWAWLDEHNPYEEMGR